MFDKSNISLTEATVLALQGKLKLEEAKPTKRSRKKIEAKEVKTEDLNVKVDDVSVSVDEVGNTIVETEDATVIVTDKEENEEAIEEPTEAIIGSDETIDVPVEGDETIVPEEEVSEETVEEITDEPEDIEEESKGLEENKEVKTEGFANGGDSIFGLKINCNNPTFGFKGNDELDDDTKMYPELARILQEIAEKIKNNGASDNETITDSDGRIIGKYGFGYEGVLDPFEESKEIGKSNKVCSGEKCENCKKTEARNRDTIKSESKQIYNKKSFEEALTKFYKFNSEKVESFKVEKILRNKLGNLKIEGKLNNKVPVTMKFDKKLEGKSFVKYTLASTNNILKESKDITTNLMLSNKDNILECKYIISR